MSDTVTEETGILGRRVAEELRALLARRRTSATVLATRLGVTQSYLARRMSGAQAFDLDDIERIARVLEIDPFDLIHAASASPTIRYDEWPHRPNVRQAVDRPRNRTDGRSPLGRRTHRTNQSVRP